MDWDGHRLFKGTLFFENERNFLRNRVSNSKKQLTIDEQNGLFRDVKNDRFLKTISFKRAIVNNFLKSPAKKKSRKYVLQIIFKDIKSRLLKFQVLFSKHFLSHDFLIDGLKHTVPRNIKVNKLLKDCRKNALINCLHFVVYLSGLGEDWTVQFRYWTYRGIQL